ncbi:MAG: cupin domain-containing protein [Thermoleophilaceae bacterium]
MLVANPLAGNELAPAGSQLVLVEWRAQAGGGDPPPYIAPLHVHRADDEAWYVLEGTLAFRLGEDEFEVEAGGAAVAPRGTPHTFWNPRPEPARYLLAMTPRIKGLIDALHSGDGRSPEEVFQDHDSELLGWP